ncbi:topology modulation protein [Shouchella shacheensis]|uniref:topology modulation protein n=1 Tax=Shouchella shacheensis TaxID=1649580 RepID=UPI00073FCF60|nr:topology modulation protein [Shouchella shacheensis]
MKRVMVIGSSAGAGKSMFSRKLSDITGLPVHHLDTFFWQPGWVEASLEEFRAKQEYVVSGSEWIIEGNYSNSYDIRAAKADTVIYLEMPLAVCLFRVLKRRVQYAGRTRPDLTEGCPEKLDFTFLSFIIRTYRPRKRKMRKRVAAFLDLGTGRQAYVIRGRKEASAFLEKLSNRAE